MNKKINNIKKKIFKNIQELSKYKFAKKKFVKNKDSVSVTGKFIRSRELKYMVDASLDGWLTSGRFNKKFEKDLAIFLDSKLLITVNSGSSANLVAFSSLTSEKLGDRSIKKNDEVISVAAGFPTTVNPILSNNAVPVFVDVDIGTYNINEQLIESAITKKTKCIMLAHTLGNPFNLKVVKDLCQKYNLWLIEDSCDALGAEYEGKKIGTHGDFGTLSFYPAHHITMGEGGAVFTNNIKLKRIAESIRDWGRDCYCQPGVDNTCGKRFCWKLGNLPFGYDHKYTYSHLGYNFKITDMQAACGLAQLSRIKIFIKKRKQNFQYLNENLKNLEEHFILPKSLPNADPSWFGFPLTIRDSSKLIRKNLINFLDEKKIGTRLLFSGNITKQPYMKNKKFIISGQLINTDKIMNDTFWVGLHPSLNKSHLNHTIDSINSYIKII